MHCKPLIALVIALTLTSVVAQENTQYPLGPIGGTYRVTANSSLALVSSVTAGAPGATAGLQTGDYIYGAFGKTFTPTGNYHYGVSQEMGFAVDRAEGGDGILPLMVIRPGTGGLTLNVNLSTPGSLGVAYPRNSPKYAAVYETAVADLHNRAMNSNGSMGYFTGWTGLALLGHPNWNDTSGAKPYRLSINKIRDFVINELYNSNYAPNENLLLDGTSNPNHAGGMSNWQLGQKIMFLSEYWAKTADPNPVTITVGGNSSTVTVNQALQRGVEMCGNVVQWWKQPAQHSNGFSPEYAQVAGMSSHGGVTGDYMHQGWYCGINITGCYGFNGMAFGRRAGMDMTVRPKDGHYFGYSLNPGDPIPAPIANALPSSITLPQYGADPAQGSTINNPFYYDPSVHQKFTMQLNFLARRSAWYSAGNNDDGMVGYAPEAITAYDAGGRTPGTLLGMAMFNQDVGGLDTADQNRMESLKGYITRNYMRHQEAHAYCVGAQAYQALCAPYLSDRQQRFFMDNWRFFFALSRTPSNGIQYFPSRNVWDNYLDTNHCASVNIALPYAIANGRYSLVPAYNTNRTLANFKSPFLMWPSLAARTCTVNSSSQTFDVDVCDGNGNVLAPGTYTCTWAHVTGPATATFSSTSTSNTTVTFPSVSATPYRIRLTVSRAGVPDLTEDIDVTRANVSVPVANAITSHPSSRTGIPGGSVNFSVGTTGTGPFLYQWRLNGVAYWGASTNSTLSLTNLSVGHAGVYDCVISTPTGTLTCNPATLTIAVTPSVASGGLKREVWNSASGSAISDLTGLSSFPLFPSSTGTVTTFETPAAYADNYGQKISGWIVPPTTGPYKFFIASDDASELWLSTDSGSSNKVRIAQVTGYTSTARAYSSGGQSAFITLTAGQRYYVEVLHKEGGGGDHLAVAWQLPGGSAPANGSDPIDGAYLQYESFVPIPAYNGLVSWWKMNETTGTLASDTVSSNDGTVSNGSTAGATWSGGKHLGGLAFDGNDKVTCGNLGSLSGNTAFTVSAWVKVTAGTNTDGIIVQQRAVNGYDGQYQLLVNSSGRIGFYVYGNGVQQFNFTGSTTINDGQWHHVAATRDTLGNAWIYLDGVVNGSVTGTTVRGLNSSIDVGIGADIRDSVKFFKGVIDDVRVYNRLLAAGEVQAIQNQAPAFASDPFVVSASEDSPMTTVISAVDFESDAISYIKTSGPAWLSISSSGALSGTPTNSEVGENTFTVRITDSLGAYSESTLSVMVANTNDAPAWPINPIHLTATEDVALSDQLSASDMDAGDTLTYSKVSGPAWLSVDPGGVLSGAPNAGDVGNNAFIVRVSDGTTAADATLHIVVTGANDPPVWSSNPINLVAIQSSAFAGQLLATDEEGEPLTFSKVNGPAWLTVSSTGALTGSPGAGSAGINTFTVRVTDGSAEVDATLNVNVTVPAVWINTSGGSWATAGNWSGGTPASGSGVTADFSTLNLASNATVTLDGARTVGGLKFRDATPSHDWSIGTGNAGPLTLDLSSGTPNVEVVNRTATIAAVVAGSDGLSKSGAGTLVLSGNNTYTGDTVISGGTLTIGGTGTLGTGTYAGAITNHGSLVLGTSSAQRLSGAISGTGGILKSGSSAFYFTGTHPYSGITTIAAGYLEVTQAPLSISNSVLDVTSTDTRAVDIWAGKLTVRGLTGTGQLACNGGYNNGSGWWWNTDPTSLSIGVPNGESYSFGGILKNFTWQTSAKMTVEKTGAGTQIFTSANTYTGATSVRNGVLLVNGSLAASAVTVDPTGTLGGSGTLGGTVANNGTLAPGNQGVGKLTVNQAVTLGAGSSLAWQVSDWNGTFGVGYDNLTATSLNVTATSVNPVLITISESALVNFSNVNQSFTLVRTTGGITGFDAAKFAINATGFTSAAGTWSVQQSGNDLVLVYTSSNVAPVFGSNPINLNASEDSAFSGQLVATDANAGDTLTYSKVSGPDWLGVSSSGALSGTPTNGEVGANTFTVRATDPGGLFAEATLQIQVTQTNPDSNGNGMLDSWETAKFGNAAPGANPPDADVDGDGMNNLMEYALDTHPLQGNSNPINMGTTQVGADSFLQLTIPKNPLATNLSFEVEATGDLQGGSWSSASTVLVSETANQLVVRDHVPQHSTNRRFMRLKVRISPEP